jgi:hypothetical protein
VREAWIGIVGVATEIRTGYLQNTSQKDFSLHQLSQWECFILRIDDAKPKGVLAQVRESVFWEVKEQLSACLDTTTHRCRAPRRLNSQRRWALRPLYPRGTFQLHCIEGLVGFALCLDSAGKNFRLSFLESGTSVTKHSRY